MMWAVVAAVLVCAVCIHDAAASEGYHDPRLGNGSMLLMVPETYPWGLGEPINVIISAESDHTVLNPTNMHGGLYNYFEALGFGGECFGLHMGNKQIADLGDGQGNQTQMSILRYRYFKDPYLGTCLESIYGGSHVRLFRQASSGAYFMASSVERDATKNHDLSLNAYDSNRNYIAGNATGVFVEPYMIGTTLISGQVTSRGWRYSTNVTWDSSLLLGSTRTNYNHYDRVQAVGSNVTDGWTAILTVTAERMGS